MRVIRRLSIICRFPSSSVVESGVGLGIRSKHFRIRLRFLQRRHYVYFLWIFSDGEEVAVTPVRQLIYIPRFISNRRIQSEAFDKLIF